MQIKEPLTPFRFKKIQRMYWVLDYKNSKEPQWKYWINHPGDAPPATNDGMAWRRPTYDEALLRQWYFENDPVRFFSEVEHVAKFATHLRGQWRKDDTTLTPLGETI